MAELEERYGEMEATVTFEQLDLKHLKEDFKFLRAALNLLIARVDDLEERAGIAPADREVRGE